MSDSPTPSERDGGDPAAPDPSDVLKLYRKHRIEHQATYYDQRARTYELARRQAVTAATVLLIFSSLFGALGAADAPRRAAWAFIAASLAAVAAATTTYEAAFGFERLSRQFQDTLSAIRIAESRMPHPETDARAPDPGGDVQAFVSRVEGLLRSEVETWPQLTAERDDLDRG